MLGLVVYTFSSEYMYSRRKMQNFPLQFQTQLSKKLKPFSGFLIAFLKRTTSLEHFEQKHKPSSLSVPQIIDSKRIAYSNV